MMGEDAEVLELWQACYSGDTSRVEDLIRNGVNFEQRDRNGESVLHMAARSGSVQVLEVLLGHLDPNMANNNLQTALHLSASKGHTQVVQALTDAGCDLNRKTKFSEMTALHLACEHDRQQVVRALLDGGAVCSVPDTIGKPPEFYTSNPKILRLFHKHAKHCMHDGIVPSATSRPLTASSDEDVHDPEEPPEETLASKQRRQSSVGRKAQMLLKMARRKKGRNMKINHSMGFSEQHKQRMGMNVFDRLGAGGKKK